MTKDLLDLDATPERLRALAVAGVLPPQALERALELAVASPPRSWWRRFLSTTLLGLGALLGLSGVISFFAFNWAALHRFGKFGLLMAAIAAAALAAWRLGERTASQFALLFAAVLVGPLLAVYGQAYQTGADPYELFLGWGALILPWVVLARFAPLWLFELILANTAVILFWEQVLDEENPAALVLTLAVLNGTAWIVTEFLAHRQVSGLQGRWLPRILAVMTLFPLMSAAEEMAVDLKADDGALQILCVALLVLALAGMYAFHRQARSELFFLTLGAACVVTLVSTLVGRALFDGLEDVLAFLFMPLVLIGEIAIVVWWLRNEARTRGTEDT
ncbi:DUF2157 domain-containing protein [Hyalangium sp.]|uniref:DUF2157 domain-containing protein n=1 Tax=Hyalangium sp. TaxID=2028555 RepID=UPI002D2233DE|nr:DUF2157 domain-containing protein [Hyalangium sp.]HYI02915.1 DUF2157 domain-containing protein [Hyalangium sp.]